MAKRYRAKRIKSAPYERENPVTASVGSVTEFSDEIDFNIEQENLQSFLRSVHFKKRLFGGVSESDVWKKISELNTLYETALAAERTRFNALLEERTGRTKITVRNEREDDE